MAVYNKEFDDVSDDNGCYDDGCDDLPPPPDVITVKFTVDGVEIRGRVIADADGKARTKIVFVARSWRGPKPTHGEELSVLVAHETKPEDPRRGVLFVERIIPLAKIGGHHAKCTKCRDYTVPAQVEVKPHQWRFVRYASCERCKTFHEIEYAR